MKNSFDRGRIVRNFMDDDEREIYKKFLPENKRMSKVTIGPRTLVGLTHTPEGERIVRVDGREVARYNVATGVLSFRPSRADWGDKSADYDAVIEYFEDQDIPYTPGERPPHRYGPIFRRR